MCVCICVYVSLCVCMYNLCLYVCMCDYTVDSLLSIAQKQCFRGVQPSQLDTRITFYYSYGVLQYKPDHPQPTKDCQGHDCSNQYRNPLHRRPVFPVDTNGPSTS